MKTHHQVGSQATRLVEELITRGVGLDRISGHEASIEFRAKVDSARQLDAADRLARYAIRIAESDGELIYEEMHKVISLLEDIEALSTLGLPPPDELLTRLETACRQRFEREEVKMRLVAEDLLPSAWNRSSWWFQWARRDA